MMSVSGPKTWGNTRTTAELPRSVCLPFTAWHASRFASCTAEGCSLLGWPVSAQLSTNWDGCRRVSARAWNGAVRRGVWSLPLCFRRTGLHDGVCAFLHIYSTSSREFLAQEMFRVSRASTDFRSIGRSGRRDDQHNNEWNFGHARTAYKIINLQYSSSRTAFPRCLQNGGSFPRFLRRPFCVCAFARAPHSGRF